METAPEVVVIGGPNGSGKSTLARFLLPEGMPFVNADEIAKSLSPVTSGNREIEAGRILIQQMEALSAQRLSFAVETTLASRTLAPRVARLRSASYRFRLIFLWLPSVDLAIERVAARVRRGGHTIPEATIRRRYAAGLHNFHSLYRPLADTWHLYGNLHLDKPELIAEGGSAGKVLTVQDTHRWRLIESPKETEP